MARKRRRKPGLQRCSICGEFQLPGELAARICLVCLGRVAVKRRRPPAGPRRGEREAAEPEALEAALA